MSRILNFVSALEDDFNNWVFMGDLNVVKAKGQRDNQSNIKFHWIGGHDGLCLGHFPLEINDCHYKKMTLIHKINCI